MPDAPAAALAWLAPARLATITTDMTDRHRRTIVVSAIGLIGFTPDTARVDRGVHRPEPSEAAGGRNRAESGHAPERTRGGPEAASRGDRSADVDYQVPAAQPPGSPEPVPGEEQVRVITPLALTIVNASPVTAAVAATVYPLALPVAVLRYA